MELTIGLFIASLVITGIYRTYRYITISSIRERQKAELQQEIVNVSNIIERDMRMAGYGLPGNGVDINLTEEPPNHIISSFSNDSQTITRLKVGASSSDISIIVENASAFSINGYVCLAETNHDTVYRRITNIGIHGNGFDTLYLSNSINTSNFTTNASVHPATRVSYHLTQGSPKKIERHINGVQFTMGTKLDSIAVILKNAGGTPVVGASIRDAQTVTVVVGGHIGEGNNRVFLSDSVEVNIRNVN